MSYKLQPISCTNTLHTHSGVRTNLYRTPTQSPQSNIRLSPSSYTLQLDLLCKFTNLYRSRLCDITNTYLLCNLTEKCFNLYVQLLHFCNRRQTPQFLSLNFYFLLLHFLLFCNINVLHKV